MKNLKNLSIFIAATFCILTFSISSQAQSAKMKKLMAEIKAEFPDHEKKVSEICEGATVKFDVDFASFGDNFDALQRVPMQGLFQTQTALRNFCRNLREPNKSDPVNVGIIKEKVKKVMIRQVAEASQKKISLQSGGVLLIEMAFHDSAGGFSAHEIKQKLGDVL